LILKRLELTNFRCIRHADIELDDDRNLIIGRNGSGKTSLLEGAFVLGTGHSFKASSLDMLVQNGAQDFCSVGRFDDSAASRPVVGIRFGKTGREIRIDGQSARGSAELAKLFPVQVIDPEVHQLLEEGPRRRRTFVDWGVFHVEQSFHDSWRRFNRALKQRNAQLKSGRVDFGVWDTELATYGTAISESRRRYAEALTSFIAETGDQLLGQEITVEYLQGWRKNLTLPEALIEARVRDRQRLTTTVGPHRGDLVIKIDGHIAKDRVSRGQQKIVACCLLLAQQRHLVSFSTQSACLLLDDPAAELDVDNLGKLLDLVSALPVQLIATSLHPSTLSFFNSAKKFHVEHGSVKAVA